MRTIELHEIKEVLAMSPMPDYRLVIKISPNSEQNNETYEYCEILNQSIIRTVNGDIKYSICFIKPNRKVEWIDIMTDDNSEFRLFNYKMQFEKSKFKDAMNDYMEKLFSVDKIEEHHSDFNPCIGFPQL